MIRQRSPDLTGADANGASLRAAERRLVVRRPGLLRESAQPVGRMKAGPWRLKAIVELIAHDLAGLRLHVDQARRPGQGAGPGENAAVGFLPPWFGRRAAGQAVGQLQEPRPTRIPQRLLRPLRDRRPALARPPLL